MEKENKKIVGVYHSRDLDGWMSGIIMKYAIPTIQLVPYDYGQPIPDCVWDADDVIIADVSFEIDNYCKFVSLSDKTLLLIDHHASKIQDVFESGILNEYQNIKYYFDDAISASELCWKFLMPNKEIPYCVQYVGINDMKNRQDLEVKYLTEIKPYCTGIAPYVYEYVTTGNFYKTHLGGMLENVSVRAFIFFISSSEDEKNRYIEKGFTLMCAKKLDHQLIASSRSHVRKIDNLTAICLNYPLHEPDIFESVYNPEMHDMMFLYYHDGEKYICSVYSHKPEIDASEIAKKFGGGGHSYAAGFRTDSIMKVFGS